MKFFDSYQFLLSLIAATVLVTSVAMLAQVVSLHTWNTCGFKTAARQVSHQRDINIVASVPAPYALAPSTIVASALWIASAYLANISADIRVVSKQFYRPIGGAGLRLKVHSDSGDEHCER